VPVKFDSLLSDIIATVIGGSILTLLLFIAKEWLFPFPNISGQWYFETHTVSTAYKPFSGMVLRYVAMIWQEGDVVRGSVEKVYERSSTGERSYVGKDRTRGTLEGRVEKLYLSKDKVRIHLAEEGIQRNSTVVFDLVKDSASEMSGMFYATAGDGTGTVKWQRTINTETQSVEQANVAAGD
jgi:hypothetical protein